MAITGLHEILWTCTVDDNTADQWQISGSESNWAGTCSWDSKFCQESNLVAGLQTQSHRNQKSHNNLHIGWKISKRLASFDFWPIFNLSRVFSYRLCLERVIPSGNSGSGWWSRTTALCHQMVVSLVSAAMWSIISNTWSVILTAQLWTGCWRLNRTGGVRAVLRIGDWLTGFSSLCRHLSGRWRDDLESILTLHWDTFLWWTIFGTCGYVLRSASLGRCWVRPG